jgi:anaerobic magnesium-protoporphyrin IX monomethyl ester cyclase
MRFTMVLAEIRSDFPGFSGYYSEGVASLAAVLRTHGHKVTLVHLTRPESPARVADRVAATFPDVIGYSCMSHTFGYVASYASAIRRLLPGIPSIIGGIHAMLHPEECLATHGIDAVCTGEGEIPLPEFVTRIGKGHPWNDIPGIWTTDAAGIHRMPPAPAVNDLDTLPFPDRTLFQGRQLMSAREHILYAYASRGCPFDCAFCCNDALRARLPSDTPPMRMKSPARVCAEITCTAEFLSGNLLGIYFQDDLFPLSLAWLEQFAAEYRTRVGIPFNCNLRADVVNEERVRLLVEAGCVSASIGVESGNETMRAELLGKKIGNAEFGSAFRLLARAGIRINTFSMVGLPGESTGDAIETICLNSHPAVNKPLCSIFYPYYGTALYNRCKADGILTGQRSDTYQQISVLRQATISRRQVEFLHDFFAPLVAGVRRFGRESGVMKGIFALIMKDSMLLGPCSRLYRLMRWLAIGPYIAAGRIFVNRQRRVFG